MNVSEKIRFMRQLQGWSQEQMAEKLGMSLHGYGNIERGDTDVQLSRLEQIAEVLGTNPAELMSFGEKNTMYFFGDHYQNISQTLNMHPEAVMAELHSIFKRNYRPPEKNWRIGSGSLSITA